MPLPYRWLTSLMVRYNGTSILIDCGEGTQVAMKKKGWSPKPIDVICFTHYHADHISGLPGLLLSMGNADRTEPLLMVGPKGLERVVNSLRVIAPDLPFEIRFHELGSPEETIRLEKPLLKDLRIEAFRVNHNVTCYGYSICLDRAGRFDMERAVSLGIPRMYWSRLQKGAFLDAETGEELSPEAVQQMYSGKESSRPESQNEASPEDAGQPAAEHTDAQGRRILTPDMVLGPARKGLRVTYTTDTRPCSSIVAHAKGADLFICEGMYGEADKFDKAKEHKHMMFTEAACLARDAGVKEMWLTHYSPSLVKPEPYMDEVRKIFPNSVASRDGRTADLMFEGDE